MPKIIRPIPDVMESITRPIVYDILRKLFVDLGMSSKTLIFFPDSTGSGKQPGTAIDAENKDVAIFPHKTQLTVEVDETYEHTALLSTAVFRPEHPFIFRDDDLEVAIKPVYAKTELSISFKYTSRDKAEAIRWRDDFRGRISMMRDEFLFMVKYYYLHPYSFIHILKEIHRLRENVAGYGEDWVRYFSDHTSPNTTVVNNQAGLEPRYAIAEPQKRIQGWFDADGMPEQGSKEGDSETWSISCVFKLTYEKPIEMAMMYPLVFHNQMIGQSFRPSSMPYRLNNTPTRFSLSTEQFNHFESGSLATKLKTLPGYAIPEYDEFAPGSIIPGTMRLFTTLLTIDENDPTLLFNLKEVPGFSFDPAILKYMVADHMNLHLPKRSMILVSLYQGPDLMTHRFLTIDKDLNVRTTTPLNIRKYHHVRVGIVTRLSELPPDVIDKARDHGDVIIKIIDATHPDMKDKCGLPKIVGKNNITRMEFARATNCIDKDLLNKGDRQEYSLHTVGTIFVESYHANPQSRP